MTDWLADNRPFSEVLKAWQKQNEWPRSRCAQELHVSLGMFNQWCSGQPCSREESLRLLMTYIDGNPTVMRSTIEREVIDRAIHALEKLRPKREH